MVCNVGVFYPDKKTPPLFPIRKKTPTLQTTRFFVFCLFLFLWLFLRVLYFCLFYPDKNTLLPCSVFFTRIKNTLLPCSVFFTRIKNTLLPCIGICSYYWILGWGYGTKFIIGALAPVGLGREYDIGAGHGNSVFFIRVKTVHGNSAW